MKKEEILKVLESAGDADYVLRTNDEDIRFLDNFKSSILESEVGAKSQLYLKLEDDIYQITGNKKNGTEPINKYLKGQLSELKSKADKVSELEEEITELRKGKPDSAKMEEIKDLQKQITKMKAQHEAELTELSKMSLKSSVKSEIERGLMGLKIKSGIPESMMKIYIDKVVNELSEKAEIRDGKTIFLDDEGKALRDPQTMAPFTAEALLRDRLKEVIDTGRKIDGPGLPHDEMVKKVNGKSKLNVLLPDSVKTREDLGQYLVKELGIKNHTQEYRDLYAEYGKDLPAFKK